MALSGCEDNNFSDLNQYIARVKSEPKESIQPLPKVIKVESFEFKLNKQRDPFEAIDQYEFPNTENGHPTLLQHQYIADSIIQYMEN